jgi:hypothetical protein
MRLCYAIYKSLLNIMYIIEEIFNIYFFKKKYSTNQLMQALIFV